MRFKASLQNVNTFIKLTASLSTLEQVAWLRLDDNDVRFTVIPGKVNQTQVWSVLAIETIFETYSIQSAAAGNAINLKVSLPSLLKALKSAATANSADIRLTKKDGKPLLSLTIYAEASSHATAAAAASRSNNNGFPDSDTNNPSSSSATNSQTYPEENSSISNLRHNREITITQDVPVKVIAPSTVETLHEPRSKEPDVHINLPNLLQLKSISDRFTKLAVAKTSGASGNNRTASTSGPKLELSANMHGVLRLALVTDSLSIQSQWTGLTNPELDPSQLESGSQAVAEHPSTIMRGFGDSQGESVEGWARVKVDGRDWGKVLSVGRLGPSRVIAGFVDGVALVLYVFLGEEGGRGESVLTYYITCYGV